MGCCAIQTVMCWSVCGDLAVVEFFRGDDHYVFGATAKTLQGSLRLVGQCAANPELSLTWGDAAQITKSLRQIVPEPIVTPPNVAWLGWVFIVSCAFWIFLVSSFV